MDPLVFELLGGLLVGGMVWLTVFHRPTRQAPQTMPLLSIRKTRTVISARRQRSLPGTKAKSKVAVSKSKKRPKMKAAAQPAEAPPTPSQPTPATTTLSTCPSCGLQAPETLLAEHFIGSPSHRNGAQKAPTIDPRNEESDAKTKEDESKQSVRNLLQILVPPRAFGLRHAQRSASSISPLVHELGPRHRHYP